MSKKKTEETPQFDPSALTPEQLQAAREALKEHDKQYTEKRSERFQLIDTMLSEKDADAVTPENEYGFTNTTADIYEAELAAGLIPPGTDRQTEIKKIQARKQSLEKKTDEAGQLVHDPNTYGYKPSDRVGFGGPNAGSIIRFLQDPEKVGKLTPEERAKIHSLTA